MKFGLFADSHYCKKESIGTRRPFLSDKKIKEALAIFKKEKVSFFICLGDMINAENNDAINIENIKHISAILNSIEIPHYLILGNHDLEAFEASDYEAMTGIKTSPFTAIVDGYRIILLDANYYRDGKPYKKGANDWTNAYIPPLQLSWLEKALKNKEPVYIFIHQNLDDEGRENDPHLVSNSAEVRKIIEKSGCVKAVYQGHYHPGLFHIVNDIPYITLRAMCEGETNHYMIVNTDA